MVWKDQLNWDCGVQANRWRRDEGYPGTMSNELRARIPTEPYPTAQADKPMRRMLVSMTLILTAILGIVDGDTSPAADPPNILLIVSDDQGYNWIGWQERARGLPISMSLGQLVRLHELHC